MSRTLHARLEHAVHHMHEDDDAAVLVEPGVEDEPAQGRVGVALRRRHEVDDGLEDLVDPDALLGGGEDGVGGVDADDVLDLLPRLLRLRAGKVDLVQHGHDLEPGVHGQVRVGEGLRFHALAGVHDQKRPLAGGQAARHLVGEVHVPRGIDEVQDVVLPVLRLVVEAHRVLLDGDPALALEVHGIEELLAHLALGEGPRALHQAVGEGRFPVIDVGDDREVADVLHVRDLSVYHSLNMEPATCITP
jgi:hypothetical protein